MIQFNLKKNIIIMLTILIIGFGYVLYSGYDYVNSYYQHEHITGVDIVLIHYKPGQDSTMQSIKTTDKNEIAEVVSLLNDRTVIKLFPDIGSIKANENDRFELRIELISSTNLTLEYSIVSSGEVEINKGFVNKFSNTMVFRGSSTKWFNEINALFEEKKQDLLWSYRKPY
ncbi:hypothetical protein PMSD_06265 [Paenibacillus macquariensis subsp. defensor]|nr:hypothetical protein PMSD_06265 [Paenibacillus macquariensis subsp. defensor]